MKQFCCSRCNRKFTTAQGVEMHIRDKHDGQGVGSFEKHKPRDEEDESMADRAVQAELDRACGIVNDDIDWLLP